MPKYVIVKRKIGKIISITNIIGDFYKFDNSKIRFIILYQKIKLTEISFSKFIKIAFIVLKIKI